MHQYSYRRGSRYFPFSAEMNNFNTERFTLFPCIHIHNNMSTRFISSKISDRKTNITNVPVNKMELGNWTDERNIQNTHKIKKKRNDKYENGLKSRRRWRFIEYDQSNFVDGCAQITKIHFFFISHDLYIILFPRMLRVFV